MNLINNNRYLRLLLHPAMIQAILCFGLLLVIHSTANATSPSYTYLSDTTPPDNPQSINIQDSPSGSVISPGSWTRSSTPYFSWEASIDDQSGVMGYCLYFGTDSGADPVTTKGTITESSPLGTTNCQYLTSSTSFDTSGRIQQVNTDTTYYLLIKAIDNDGNINSSIAQTSVKIDTNPPFVGSLGTVPAAVGSKIFHVSWITGPLTTIYEDGSGFAGLKYCVSALAYGATCDPNSTSGFYGLQHTSGDPHDPNDVIPFDAAGFDTVAADAANLDDSIALANQVYVVAVDNAGNVSSFIQGVVVITQLAASAPQNLQVSPTNNTQNAFSFTWDEPSFKFGGHSDLEYCWTVNVSIAADGSNCNWTGRGVYALAQGAYATQQGTNTLYIATKDVTGNFDGTQFTSVDFDTATTAPGPPRNLDSSDASIRATSTWKIALSWTAPDLSGAGISSYKVFRSTDNVTFSEVGSTTAVNTGFVDSGITQLTYYYYVKACDNASSCSAPSNTVSRIPTGRFTTPAKLTADTDQPKIKDIGTKKANIYWLTDRGSDSKVAFGTKPGQYFPEEIGNSTQTANHSVLLTNLQPSTTYYYIAKWTDADGNTGVSNERTFTTLPPPTISETVALNIGIDSASIQFRSKDASKVNIYFGKSSLGGVKTINTASRDSTYTVLLSGLDDGAKYSYKLNGVDADGNEYQGNTYSFFTLPRPKITNLRFQPVDGAPSSTQQVSWNTNVPATSSISYGPESAKQTDVLDEKLVTQHEVIISGLLDDTAYTLIARSIDSVGNVAVSDNQSFHTALDTRPPKITDYIYESSIQGTGTEARGQIIVSWKTDEAATSQVAFGQGQSGALTNRSVQDTRLTKNHTVVLSDLSTSTVYRVKAISSDKAGNASQSDTQTAIIGRGSDSVFTIVYNALQKIFGLGG